MCVYTTSLGESQRQRCLEWVANLEGYPSDEPITGSGIIPETGCPGGMLRERTRGEGPTYTHRVCQGVKVDRDTQDEGRRDPGHSLCVGDDKVHETTQRRKHRGDGLYGLGLEEDPRGSLLWLGPKGSLIDRTILI